MNTNSKYKNKQQPLQKKNKNNFNKIDRLTKEVKKVEKIVKKRKIPRILPHEMAKVEKNAREINNYISSLKYDKGVQFPHFPLCNSQPFHIAKRQGITTTQVNSAGIAFIEITPTLFANISTGNNTSPIFQMGAGMNAYNDVNGTLFAFGGANLPLAPNVSNFILNANVFHTATVIGYSCVVTVTGVSTMNRQGSLYLIQYEDDQFFCAQRTSVAQSGGTNLDVYVNARPLSAMVNYPHKYYKEISTTNNNSVKYSWIPNFGPYTIDQYDMDMSLTGTGSGTWATQGLVDLEFNLKKLCIYAYGMPTSAVVQIEHQVHYMITPQPASITDYPVRYGNDYRDITPQLQLLCKKNPFSDTVYTGNYGFIAGVNQYVSTNNNIKETHDHNKHIVEAEDDKSIYPDDDYIEIESYKKFIPTKYGENINQHMLKVPKNRIS